uniref:Uncharacterized protein n=1 Tax=Glossina palpalis gambiensis TaxID=67801 RepID=A0A1B0BSP7_9MUSC
MARRFVPNTPLNRAFRVLIALSGSGLSTREPLSFSLFNSIVDVITPVLKCHLNASDDMETFWNGAKCILPSCVSVLRKLRAKNVSDKQIVKTFCNVLDIFAKVNTLLLPESIDLFPPNIYGWISAAEGLEYNVDRAIEDAIHAGTKEWLEHIIEGKFLCPNEDLAMENFHTWFMIGVTHWLDISVIKALNRIEKSIKLDKLVAVE